MEDESEYVRWRAIEALGKIGDKRGIEPLIQALKDGNEHVREEAAMALVRIGDAVVKPLIAALKSGDTEVRKRAAETLVKIGEYTDITSPEKRIGAEITQLKLEDELHEIKEMPVKKGRKRKKTAN